MNHLNTCIAGSRLMSQYCKKKFETRLRFFWLKNNFDIASQKTIFLLRNIKRGHNFDNN